MAVPGVARRGEDWRYLEDVISNHEIKFSFSLHNIKTVCNTFGIDIK